MGVPEIFVTDINYTGFKGSTSSFLIYKDVFDFTQRKSTGVVLSGSCSENVLKISL